MKIHLFGNEDFPEDSRVLGYMKKLEKDFPEVDFVVVKPNEDLPFEDQEDLVIMDAVAGITEARLLTEKDFDKLKLSPRTTVHDFDLGFQLKLLKKLGKLGKVTILGIPMTGKTDYSSIHSMVKKLVAQDMQGS